MQYENNSLELPDQCFNELDHALNELGMLATRTKSREEYLNEIHKKNYKMLTVNTRYVSNVSFGLQVRPCAPHTRFKPYKLPSRHRTKSENNDGVEPANLIRTLEDNIIEKSLIDLSHLKRAKSLESIIAENNQNVNFENFKLAQFPEVEIVSNCIQNLRVDEC